MNNRVTVRVDGRNLQLSNLDKVLYPESGFAKRDVLFYYQRAAPAMLAVLREGEDLVFAGAAVLGRLDEHGDLLADRHDDPYPL